MANPNVSSGRALWLLLFGNLVIGTSVLLPAGLLNALSSDLGTSPSRTGLLMLVGGVTVAIGAPLLAGLTSSFDRRKLLAFALTLCGLGHLAGALVSDLQTLLILRAITVVGAAIYTPQAAATAGLLVPTERRAAAIAFIFIGWSAASVAGIPLGSYFAELLGWRWVFVGMAALSTVAALWLWIDLAPGLFVERLNADAWTKALTSPAILMVLLVTLLSMSGQMTVFSYVAPLLRDGFAASPAQISLAFAIAGIAGVGGNALAARIVGRFGVDRVIATAVAALVMGFAIFASGFGTYGLALLGIAVWGLGSFSSNSLQQSRLVGLAPRLAAATVALNTSVVYMGQAVGAALGGWFMAQGTTPSIAWTACGLTGLACAASWVAARVSPPH